MVPSAIVARPTSLTHWTDPVKRTIVVQKVALQAYYPPERYLGSDESEIRTCWIR